MRETQGRCHVCQIRYVWPSKKGPLRGAHCEACGAELRQTVHYVKNRRVWLDYGPVYDEESVRMIQKRSGVHRRVRERR